MYVAHRLITRNIGQQYIPPSCTTMYCLVPIKFTVDITSKSDMSILKYITIFILTK